MQQPTEASSSNSSAWQGVDHTDIPGPAQQVRGARSRYWAEDAQQLNHQHQRCQQRCVRWGCLWRLHGEQQLLLRMRTLQCQPTKPCRSPLCCCTSTDNSQQAAPGMCQATQQQ